MVCPLKKLDGTRNSLHDKVLLSMRFFRTSNEVSIKPSQSYIAELMLYCGDFIPE
jgi:hypothetical protein